MNVPVNPVQSRLLTNGTEAIITSPAPLLASKNTFSPTGTVAPLDHHEVRAQFVVESQYPFPPDTQYLLTAGFVSHPMFPVTYVVLAPAVHVAPPVTPISWSDK